MNANKILNRFLSDAKSKFSFNIVLVEEIFNLEKEYNTSVSIIQGSFLTKEQTESFNSYSKDALLIIIRNNFIESYPKPIADALIKSNISFIEKHLDIIFSFEEKFNNLKEELSKEGQKFNNFIGFDLLTVLEDKVFQYGHSGLNKESILKQYNKYNSTQVLLTNILLVLENS